MSQPIFLYWHQGWEEAPHLVKKCAESWVRHHENTDWTVHLLDHHNVQDWLAPCPEEDRNGLHHFLIRYEQKENVGGLNNHANLLRLTLLDHYGGVWTDATTLCFQSLDTWLPSPVCMGMPHSLAAERRTETWFIDNRCKDPVLTQWKQRYRDLYFSAGNKITYLDNWSTRRYQIAYWMLNVGMRGTAPAARIWNSRLALKWLRIRPYFATNAILEYVLRVQIPTERMAKLHQLILPISSELMWELHNSDWSQPMTPYASSRFESAPFLKLNHKSNWAAVIDKENLDFNSAWAVWLQRAGVD